MNALAMNSITPVFGTRPVVPALPRDYCLHDFAGRLLGTIAAPARRPVVGPAAPTFYLRRNS